MGGMKFFTNISSLGLEGDTATPNSVIDAMPYRSALVVASSVFTNPAWNFPDGRYTLEIISVTGGRAIISLYGKTPTEADYRMFLNNENNYPSGEWTKIISNADIVFLSGVDQVQFDCVNQAEYIKVVSNGIIYQLTADPTGIHYDKCENNVWSNIWHITN